VLSLKDLQVVLVNNKPTAGVVIGFDHPVQLAGVDDIHVFTVDIPTVEDKDSPEARWRACRCGIKGRIAPVVVEQFDGPERIVLARDISASGATSAEALAFVFTQAFLDVLTKQPPADFWIRLRGDFVRDENQRAVDAEFVRAQLPTGDRPAGSPHGIQGGLFESWFRFHLQVG